MRVHCDALKFLDAFTSSMTSTCMSYSPDSNLSGIVNLDFEILPGRSESAGRFKASLVPQRGPHSANRQHGDPFQERNAFEAPTSGDILRKSFSEEYFNDYGRKRLSGESGNQWAGCLFIGATKRAQLLNKIS